jgi:starch-binding outer membrane protein SusE/F
MRSIFNALLLVTGVAFMIASCDKVGNLPVYQSGTNPVLTASTTAVAAAASDSNKVVLVLNWTAANHATDSSHVKYTIEIDSSGRNFSKEWTTVVTNKLVDSFTAKALNDILLGYGYAFNVPVDMDVRVTSSYTNNNEKLSSNVIKIRMTPYKIPPKVALPTSGRLFIVGSASQGGWNNPVPTPGQELTNLSETKWGGIFQLNGGSEYLLLPVNGDWSHKFAVQDNSVPGLNQGGNFGYDLSQNFPGPSASGAYKIIVDFQTGKFTVTAVPATDLPPANLFIVGDATPGGWNNPVPTPSQQFSRLTNAWYEITVPLTGSKQYLLLPVNGDWSHKYAVQDNSIPSAKLGGVFGYDLSQNFPGPDITSPYKIQVNFVDKTYILIKQ